MLEDFYLGNKTVWEYEKNESTDEIAKNIADKLKIPVLLTKVLAKRGFFDLGVIKDYLRPSIKKLHDPMLLPDMTIAVNRISEALQAKQKIIIYGDYDVDGVTATSILSSFLKSLDMDISFYIPDRADEGYGISEAAVGYLLENAYDLMITVDCGISAKERIGQIQEGLLAANRQMDIIVTDHHQPNPDTIPNALAIVNPHLSTSQYPFRNLCGAGVAFKLVQALCNHLDLADQFLHYIDLAALGTVADIVELQGENRIIVWAGLKKIQRQPNLGIQTLLNVAQVNGREIDSWLLAFTLAPRVNAAGRMGDASRGVRLFTTVDPVEAEKLATQMQQDNTSRQKIQEELLNHAVEIIEQDPSYQHQKVIVVSGEGWHHGVIGIVASLLVDRFYKPCFVLSVQDDIATGSARSIDGFNVFLGMENCKELFEKYGGHELAGGLTLKTSNIELFRKKINEYADQTMKEECMVPKMRIDVEAQMDDLTMDSAEAVMAMGPFGEGNKSPVFRLSQVTVVQKKRIGASGNHLRLLLGTENKPVQAIAFRMGELEPYILPNSKIDLVYTLGINEYMGKRNVQLVVNALRLPENEIQRNRFLLEAAEKVECLDYSEEWIYNGINHRRVSYDDVRLSKAELAILYRYLQKSGNRSLNKAQLFHLAETISSGKVRLNYFKLLSGMFVLDELDIVRFALTEQGDYDLQISEVAEKATLEDSMLYNFLQTVQQVVEK